MPARTRYFGPPARVASAVTQPCGRTGSRMQPRARPAARARASPPCCTSSPRATRRSSGLAKETPSRTIRSSPREPFTRHQEPGLPGHVASSVASRGSPSETQPSSSEPGLPRKSAATAGLHARVSTNLRSSTSPGFASSSSMAARHMRRFSTPYSRSAGAHHTASKSRAGTSVMPLLDSAPSSTSAGIAHGDFRSPAARPTGAPQIPARPT
mmetsp:Transcript_116168/g.360850  ORF Transcript_116168/g.360850 Transcript_116168/m.360850 type:complete len:212 (-) Transcript_116168:3-638(-)